MTASQHAPTLPFRYKICGVTRAEDTVQALDAGADAIGINFYERSARYVSPAQGRLFADIAAGRAQRVGVFVNASPREIGERVAECELDWVQLHGDESPSQLRDLQEFRLIRAFRIGVSGIEPVQAYLTECDRLNCLPAAVLLDAAAPGHYGGTGKTLNWLELGSLHAALAGLPWILAGGLTARNVAEAILATDASAVDTASGVESAPGIKDPAQLAAYLHAARQGFARRTS